MTQNELPTTAHDMPKWFAFVRAMLVFVGIVASIAVVVLLLNWIVA
ncbi:MAG: hypothetical protein HC876_09925 [Chloroflexaceae bacterium]|nr:hypothetical protein [Chloroflexaceae bacterium]NJO05801.1 hypothetical protein [Chloroflexaceae bacterium]